MAYTTSAGLEASGFDLVAVTGEADTYDLITAQLDSLLYAPHIYAGDTLTTPPKKGTKLYAGLGASVPTEIGMAYVGDANGVPVPWFG